MTPTPIRSAIKSFFIDLEARFRRQMELAAPSGQPLLDPSCYLLPGDLAVLGARRFYDAERVLNIIALDAAAGRDVFIVTQDIRETETQLLSIATGLSLDVLARPDRLTPDEMSKAREAAEQMGKLPIEVCDARRWSAVTSQWMEDHRGGLVVLAAAWSASVGGTEDDAGTFVRAMKTMARDFDATIIMPWRIKSAGDRLDQRPMLRDLAVSGASEEDSDLVILFHESEYGVEIYKAKDRHGEAGFLYDSRDLGAPAPN